MTRRISRRTVLKGFGTALALLALSAGIQSAARQGVSERGADLTVSQRDASDVFSGFIDEALEPRVRAIAGVAGVAGELAMFAPIDGDNEFLVFGWSPVSYFWKDVPVAGGKLPAPTERGFVLLGENVAKALGKKAGDTISMFDKTIPVAAVTNYQAVRDLMALGDRLRRHYGEAVDLPAHLAGLDMDRLVVLSVGDIVAFVAARPAV